MGSELGGWHSGYPHHCMQAPLPVPASHPKYAHRLHRVEGVVASPDSDMLGLGEGEGSLSSVSVVTVIS